MAATHRATWLMVGTLLISCAVARTARAQALDIDGPATAPPAVQGTEQAVVARYWALGRPRLFGAMMLEAGYAYARPNFAFGYGQPYWRWIGLETYPVVAASGVGYYGGIGAALPGVTFRAGARYYYPFDQSLLPPQDSYDRFDIEEDRGSRGDYLALETELTGTVPLFFGSLFAVATLYRIQLVPDGFLIYEESLRTVMEPPYIWRGRLGYLLSFGHNGAVRIGPVGEVIGMPERGDHVVRAGVLGSVLINAHLEAQASFIPVIVSPDSLGVAGGDFGQLGVRFRWATGSTPDPARVREAIQR